MELNLNPCCIGHLTDVNVVSPTRCKLCGSHLIVRDSKWVYYKPTVFECGGCEGLGSHRLDCQKNPNYDYRLVLARQAKSLADNIGSNDPGSANLMYLVESRLKSGEGWNKR